MGPTRAPSLLCLSALLVAGGCSVDAEAHVHVEATAGSEGARLAPIEADNVAVAEQVAFVRTACVPDGEACNALDDNCDGVIDEGCGYESGPVQVTMSWNSGADLDLYVTDPTGELLSNQNSSVPSGGRIDHPGRGDCGTDGPHARVENAYWEGAAPPSGEYKVEVHYYGECASAAGATTVTLSIGVGGKVVGAYNRTLAPAERATIATFRIP